MGKRTREQAANALAIMASTWSGSWFDLTDLTADEPDDVIDLCNAAFAQAKVNMPLCWGRSRRHAARSSTSP